MRSTVAAVSYRSPIDGVTNVAIFVVGLLVGLVLGFLFTVILED